MPNHVHVLVHIWQMPLWKLVQEWKRFVAWRAIPLLKERRIPFRRENEPRSATAPKQSSALHRGFWQREYWDTYMRSEEQKRTAICYIENNPLKAHFCALATEWPFSSARFRNDYRKLVWPSGLRAEETQNTDSDSPSNDNDRKADET